MDNLTEDRAKDIENEMLKILLRDFEMTLPDRMQDIDSRTIVNNLMIARGVGEVSEELLSLQDKLLSYENSLNVIDYKSLKFHHGVSFCEHDLVNMNVDMLVLFSFDLLADMNNLDSMDNRVILHGGLQIKEDLASILHENINRLVYYNPYIVNAYNLHCKKLCKIIVKRNQTEQDLVRLKNAVNELIKFVKSNNYHSLAIDFNVIKEISLFNIIMEELNKETKKLKLKIIIKK